MTISLHPCGGWRWSCTYFPHQWPPNSPTFMVRSLGETEPWPSPFPPRPPSLPSPSPYPSPSDFPPPCPYPTPFPPLTSILAWPLFFIFFWQIMSALYEFFQGCKDAFTPPFGVRDILWWHKEWKGRHIKSDVIPPKPKPKPPPVPLYKVCWKKKSIFSISYHKYCPTLLKTINHITGSTSTPAVVHEPLGEVCSSEKTVLIEGV